MACLLRVLEHTTQPSVLLQEGATSHTSAESHACFARQTTRLQVFPLPTDAPDETPSEQLWKKITQQDTHVHDFPTFDALTERVEQALFTCAHAPEDVRARCGLPTA
jgi:hypothetical protein